MTAQTLSSDEETKLLTSVKTAVDLVDNQGMSPDEALIKVARDYKLTPGFVRASVNAFNNGRQLAQWNSNSSVLDKLAEFPLADYDTVHAAIWGGSEKEARDRYQFNGKPHEDYSRPPAWLGLSKLANAPLNYPDAKKPEPYTAQSTRPMVVAYSNHKRAVREFEEKRASYAQSHDLLNLRLTLLENYFKKAAMDREAFHKVDHAAQTYFGANGRALMDLLAVKLPKEKRAADTRVFYDSAVNLQLPPYSYVKAAIEAASDIYTAKQAMDQAYGGLEKAAGALSPFVAAPPQTSNHQSAQSHSLIEVGQQKEGSWLGGATVATGTRNLLDSALGPAARQRAVEEAWLDLDDPEHNNEIRKIQAQAMLTGFMSDPENPISGYSPNRILTAYNELSRMAPRVSEQPSAVQPLLAKRLSGHHEPFEVKEISDIEKGLKDSKSNTPSSNLFTNAPNSILG